MRYLLDTNVFREMGKSEPHENVRAWLAQIDDGDLAISAITVREVSKGIPRLRGKKPDTAKAIEARVGKAYDAFAERLLPVGKEVAELWGELLGAREKHIDDLGLVATASVYRLVLVSRNTRDLEGHDVAVLDPYRAPARIAADAAEPSTPRGRGQT